MIGKFLTEKGETTKQNFFCVVANRGCAMDDLQRCLTLRNIDSKRDEKQQKSEAEKTTDEGVPKNLPPITTALDLTRNLQKKNVDRSEILIEGTALNCQNLLQNTNGAKNIPHVHVQPSPEEKIACSSKDDSQAEENAISAERSLVNSPEMSLNTLADRSDQDNEHEVNLLGSPKATRRTLNPSPWKEVWSVLQDRSLATCLSTKSMDFGRDISETPFSTRTIPYSKQRRKKPQRIPPLYNTRKAVPTTHGNKAEVPSFDDAVVFNTVFRDFKRDQGIGGNHEIGRCKECLKVTELKDNSVHIEGSEGHTCGNFDNKGQKEKAIGMTNITCSPMGRYKSKFRVRLLPLVAKSDSLPNLTSTSTSAPSELIVTAPMNVVCSNENVRLECLKSEHIRSNIATESEQLIKKCRQNRSMSLDSVFSVESFAAYQGKKGASSGINVQGFQVLPDIKQTEPKKYHPPLKQNGENISPVSRTTVITLPWKCN